MHGTPAASTARRPITPRSPDDTSLSHTTLSSPTSKRCTIDGQRARYRKACAPDRTSPPNHREQQQQKPAPPPSSTATTTTTTRSDHQPTTNATTLPPTTTHNCPPPKQQREGGTPQSRPEQKHNKSSTKKKARTYPSGRGGVRFVIAVPVQRRSRRAFQTGRGRPADR